MNVESEKTQSRFSRLLDVQFPLWWLMLGGFLTGLFGSCLLGWSVAKGATSVPVLVFAIWCLFGGGATMGFGAGVISVTKFGLQEKKEI